MLCVGACAGQNTVVGCCFSASHTVDGPTQQQLFKVESFCPLFPAEDVSVFSRCFQRELWLGKARHRQWVSDVVLVKGSVALLERCLSLQFYFLHRADEAYIKMRLAILQSKLISLQTVSHLEGNWHLIHSFVIPCWKSSIHIRSRCGNMISVCIYRLHSNMQSTLISLIFDLAKSFRYI